MSLLINRAQKWAYIHIPKTGGTSISSVLSKVNGTERVTMHDSIRAFDNADGYFIFTFVRNPFTRLLSAYQHSLRKKEFNVSFQDFLKLEVSSHIWMMPQYYFVTAGSTETQNVSFIGKYENLNKDISYVFNKLNINSKLPHLNSNPIYKRHPNIKQENYYKTFYSEEWMKDCVRERYKNDFKIFNYDMDL